jgi:hypothetical protein
LTIGDPADQSRAVVHALRPVALALVIAGCAHEGRPQPVIGRTPAACHAYCDRERIACPARCDSEAGMCVRGCSGPITQSFPQPFDPGLAYECRSSCDASQESCRDSCIETSTTCEDACLAKGK